MSCQGGGGTFIGAGQLLGGASVGAGGTSVGVKSVLGGGLTLVVAWFMSRRGGWPLWGRGN